MKQRCLNRRCKEFPLYGGRGIAIDPSWLEADGFLNFLRDVGLRPTDRRCSLHRIDNDGNYTKHNVRWADQVEQTNNRNNNHRLTHAGETRTVSEWARKRGMRPGTLLRRLRAGWPVDLALDQPVEHRPPSSEWVCRNPNPKKRGPKPKPTATTTE